MQRVLEVGWNLPPITGNAKTFRISPPRSGVPSLPPHRVPRKRPGKPVHGLFYPSPSQVALVPKLRSLPSLVATVNTATVPLPPKVRAPAYATPEYRAWRTMVVARAEGRCEAVDHGHRCSRAAPHDRMYADHIKEIKDEGQVFDLNNGQCLCSHHHLIKSNQARKRRYQDK